MRANPHRFVFVALFVGFLMLPRTSSAASLLFSSYTGEAVSTDGAFLGFALGTEFTVGSTPLEVLSLGVYDSLGDGLSGNPNVGIFRVSDETLMGSASIATGTTATLIEDWRFASVGESFILAPNTTYRIVAAGLTDFPPFGGTFPTSPLLASVAPGYVLDDTAPIPLGTLEWPNRTAGTTILQSRVYANAQVQELATSPEPATLSLLGLGLGTAVVRRITRR